jgi:hypothetical protein
MPIEVEGFWAGYSYLSNLYFNFILSGTQWSEGSRFSCTTLIQLKNEIPPLRSG